MDVLADFNQLWESHFPPEKKIPNICHHCKKKVKTSFIECDNSCRTVWCGEKNKSCHKKSEHKCT